jgi:hypothetical protein
VATVEVEKDNVNRLQVQIVGDAFLYGQNYIYEPVYFHTPIIYNTFLVRHYRPYCSPWYWNFYPHHFYVWNPFPVFYYQNHITFFIGVNNTCHFVNHRRNRNFIAMHHSIRANGYERYYDGRSFNVRNRGFSNRHELTQTRDQRTRGNTSIRNTENVRNESVNTRSQINQFTSSHNNAPRTTNNNQTITPRPTVRTNGIQDLTMSYTPRSSEYSQNSNIRNTNEVIVNHEYANTNVSPRPRVRSSSTRDISFSNPTTSPSFAVSPRPKTNNVKSYSGNTSNNSTFQQPRNNQNSSVYEVPKSTRSNSDGIRANLGNSNHSIRSEVKGTSHNNIINSTSTINSGQSSNRNKNSSFRTGRTLDN